MVGQQRPSGTDYCKKFGPSLAPRAIRCNFARAFAWQGAGLSEENQKSKGNLWQFKLLI
jgi:hypothetical protein